MESQSVNIDGYLEELEIHHTTPYYKRFSLIPNSLDVDLKDKTENIPYIPTSSKTVSTNLIQGNFSKNSNTSRNSTKPHFQPIDSLIDSLTEGEETVLGAETSENITVAAALQQELETRHLPPIDLIPFDGNALNWREFIQNFKERVHLMKSFSDSMRMERLKRLFYASALKSSKKDFGDPLVVTHLRLKSVFDKPQIKSGDRIALKDFQ